MDVSTSGLPAAVALPWLRGARRCLPGPRAESGGRRVAVVVGPVVALPERPQLALEGVQAPAQHEDIPDDQQPGDRERREQKDEAAFHASDGPFEHTLTQAAHAPPQ